LATATIILFISCATGPKNVSFDEQQPVNEFADLPAGGNAYFYIDVPEMRPLLENINLADTNVADTSKILDMTESGVIGIYPEESGRKMMASANGSFPVFQSSFAMAFSPAWKKIKSDSGIKYWRSEEQNLSLALSSQKAWVSDGVLFPAEQTSLTELSRSVEVPENFFAIRQTAVMAGWVDKAGTKINALLFNVGVPLQLPAEQILFGFYKAKESSAENPLYEGTLCLEVPTASQAKGLMTIFGFARMMSDIIDDSQQIGKIIKSLLSNAPSLDGTIIKIDTGILTVDEILTLFHLFSVQ
jgi:hypothetical protein